MRRSTTDVVFQLVEYGALVSSAPSTAPSSLNWTPATATSSLAFAVTVIVPSTVPGAGAVIATEGGEESRLVTVAVAWFEAPLRLPAASSALTT